MTPVEAIRQTIFDTNDGREFLTFAGSDSGWLSVDDFRRVTDEPALYALGLKFGLQYERIISKIVYFGLNWLKFAILCV